MYFNTAFLFLLLASWFIVPLFWLRITTALLVNFLACLTTWLVPGQDTAFYLHQSCQICSIMFLLVVSHFYIIYADDCTWNYSYFSFIGNCWKGFQGEQRSSGVFGTTCTSGTYKSQWDLAECIQGCWEGLPTLLQRHTVTSLTGHGVWGKSQLIGKGQILHPSTKTEKKKKYLGNYRWVSLTWVPWKIMKWPLLGAVSGHEEEEGNWEKPTHTSANCQQFIICFIIDSIETWKHDLPHEDLGKEGMMENLHVSLCHL